jgi:hypothetical protein
MQNNLSRVHTSEEEPDRNENSQEEIKQQIDA